MSEQVRGWARRPEAVVGAGLLLVAAQVAYRAWALYPSWFYLDDYSLLLDATRQDTPGPGYLLEPWNSHLMPGGRLVAWTVAHSGSLNWPLAASITLFLQLLGGLAALWMLCTLFGRRWGVLAPLSLYLSTAMTVPALMWWTACLNQLAMQAGFFVAVAAWVRFVRSGRLVWVVAALGGIALGVLFDVKALLTLFVLVALSVGWFGTGGLLGRVRSLRRNLPATALVVVPTLAYVGYYRAAVEQPFEPVGLRLTAELTRTMLGEAFGSAVVGGPWRWEPLAPPNAFADPPGWAVTLSWLLIALVVGIGFLRRERTGRAWALLVGYLAVLVALVLTSRAPVYGELIGLEYRYLTDAACVLSLCVGLAFLELRDAPGSSAPRAAPLLTWSPPWPLVAGTVAAVGTSGLLSSAVAVHYWHHDNASESWVRTLRSDLRSNGAVDLADGPAPDPVYSAIFAPDNQVSRFTPLLSSRVSFPEASSRLSVVAADGGLRQAVLEAATRTVAGPVAGCGWRLSGDGAQIPLAGRAMDLDWWLRIGYLAEADTAVTVTAGSTRVETTMSAGLHSLFVRATGDFGQVGITGLDAGVTVCVDTVDVGRVVPGAPLS